MCLIFETREIIHSRRRGNFGTCLMQRRTWKQKTKIMCIRENELISLWREETTSERLLWSTLKRKTLDLYEWSSSHAFNVMKISNMTIKAHVLSCENIGLLPCPNNWITTLSFEISEKSKLCRRRRREHNKNRNLVVRKSWEIIHCPCFKAMPLEN